VLRCVQGPLPAGAYFTPYPDAYGGVSVEAALQSLHTLVQQQVAAAEVAAVIIEPVLGEGGYVVAPCVPLLLLLLLLLLLVLVGDALLLPLVGDDTRTRHRR
jgi:hypothetical protein